MFIRIDFHNLQVGALRLGGRFEQSPRIDPWRPTARGMPITQRDRTHGQTEAVKPLLCLHQIPATKIPIPHSEMLG